MDNSVFSKKDLISFLSNVVYAIRLTRQELTNTGDVDMSDIPHHKLCDRIEYANDNLLCISSSICKINDLLRMSDSFDVTKDDMFHIQFDSQG